MAEPEQSAPDWWRIVPKPKCKAGDVYARRFDPATPAHVQSRRVQRRREARGLMAIISSMEWRKRGDYEWWLVFKDAPESLRSSDGTLWPPSMSISWVGPGGCCHVYSYSNGYMPGDPERDETDIDYLHVCNMDDFIGELQAFKTAAAWEPAEWEKD